MEIIKKLYNKQFGIDNAIFTHSNQAILCSSPRDFRIMYWNLHNNEVIFSFLGHADLVNDIIINPKNDTFLTTSEDKTSRLWDLKQKTCLAIFQETVHSCFDNTGDVIASVTVQSKDGKSSSHINLYDSKEYQTGNFNVFRIDDSYIKQIKFPNDGQNMYCFTDDSLILINSYEGNIVKRINFELDSLSFYKG